MSGAMRRALVAAAAVLVVAIAGCGQAPAQGGIATLTPIASGERLGATTGADGWVTVVTGQGDGELQVTVTVTGPLTVEGGCIPSLTAWADASDGSPVPTPTPSGLQMHCMAIALIPVAAGASKAFSADIPTPPVPGTYTVHGLLQTTGGQPIPIVTITI